MSGFVFAEGVVLRIQNAASSPAFPIFGSALVKDQSFDRPDDRIIAFRGQLTLHID